MPRQCLDRLWCSTWYANGINYSHYSPIYLRALLNGFLLTRSFLTLLFSDHPRTLTPPSKCCSCVTSHHLPKWRAGSLANAEILTNNKNCLPHEQRVVLWFRPSGFRYTHALYTPDDDVSYTETYLVFLKFCVCYLICKRVVISLFWGFIKASWNWIYYEPACRV